MFWNIERIEGDTVSGWIYDKERPETAFTVLALDESAVVGKATAAEERPALLADGHATARCGFTIRASGPAPAASLRLVCLTGGENSRAVIIYSPLKREIGTLLASYQSFLQGSDADAPDGASDSAKKLSALMLPPLEGLSVLDLGCNEGLFSLHAWKSGAKRVLGLDTSELFIERAKARAAGHGWSPGADEASGRLEFRCASWWDAPAERFDLILLLSAIHYEDRQKELLDFLATRLAPEGRLILECGVAPGEGRYWQTVRRSIDVRRFPTKDYLLNTLLDKYSARYVLDSPAQRGDPIPRMVFHCSPRKPTVAVIRGESGSGKTSFAQLIIRQGLSVYSSDVFLGLYSTAGAQAPDTPLYRMLAKEVHGLNLCMAAQKIIRINAVEEFCRDFAAQLPLDQPLCFVEGQVFANNSIFKAFTEELERCGAVVWDIGRA